MENLITIAVIDSAVNGLFLYDMPDSFDNEQIEEFLTKHGRRIKNCSWGQIDGKIIDLRGDEK